MASDQQQPPLGWSHLHPEDDEDAKRRAAAPQPTSQDVQQNARPAQPVAPPQQPQPVTAATWNQGPPPPVAAPGSPGPYGGGYARQPPGVPMQQQGGPPAQQQQQRPQAQPPAGSATRPGQDEVLFEGIARHTASIGGYLKWFLASTAGGVGAYFLGMIDFFSTWPLWVLGFVGVPGLLWTFLRHITTRYKIDYRRVEFERGVVSKTVDSLELWRVLDVRFNAGLIDRIFGNATITLIGTDQTDPEMKLYGLPGARKLFEKLRDAVQAARHTSRPMELVGQDGMMEHVGFDQ